MSQFEYIRCVTALKVILLGMVGQWLAIHRILVQGGVFLYPGTVKKPEANCACSMSLLPSLFEQAGGRASTGTQEFWTGARKTASTHSFDYW